MMENKYNKKKIIILAIITLIVIILSSTVALYIWNSNSNQNTNVALSLNGLDAYIRYNKGTDVLTGTLLPSEDYSGGIYTEIELWKDPSASSRLIYGHIYMNITTIGINLSNEPALKWAIVSNGEILNTGNFVGKKNEDVISLKIDIPLSTTKQLFQIYIWLDETMEINDAIEGESISTIIRAEATDIKLENIVPASEYLLDIFSNAEKITATNNNVDYQYAPSVFMMEDIGGNIRYYGSTPNNYVYFNNELWRIIGVFKNIDDGTGKKETRIKIVKNESVATTQYSSNNNSSEWQTSSLCNNLNNDYMNSITIEYRSMISDALWNLGGAPGEAGLYANDYYTYERGSEVAPGHSPYWVGKIALIYISDYMYSFDLSRCNLDGFSLEYDKANCWETAWLKNPQQSMWTISTISNVVNNVFINFPFSSKGNVTVGFIKNYGDAHPALFLNSTVSIISGIGTADSPFIFQYKK